MKVRGLILALALAVTGCFGTAQAATKHPKPAKFKSTKINTKNQNKFRASHNIPKRTKVRASVKHTTRKVVAHKGPKVKAKKHS